MGSAPLQQEAIERIEECATQHKLKYISYHNTRSLRQLKTYFCKSFIISSASSIEIDLFDERNDTIRLGEPPKKLFSTDDIKPCV
jgi:hypothetical protein